MAIVDADVRLQVEDVPKISMRHWDIPCLIIKQRKNMMKYSLYNNYVKYKDGVIAFNAMTMKFLYLVPELMKLINNYPPEQIATVHPD